MRNEAYERQTTLNRMGDRDTSDHHFNELDS